MWNFAFTTSTKINTLHVGAYYVNVVIGPKMFDRVSERKQEQNKRGISHFKIDLYWEICSNA